MLSGALHSQLLGVVGQVNWSVRDAFRGPGDLLLLGNVLDKDPRKYLLLHAFLYFYSTLNSNITRQRFQATKKYDKTAAWNPPPPPPPPSSERAYLNLFITVLTCSISHTLDAYPSGPLDEGSTA